MAAFGEDSSIRPAKALAEHPPRIRPLRGEDTPSKDTAAVSSEAGRWRTARPRLFSSIEEKRLARFLPRFGGTDANILQPFIGKFAQHEPPLPLFPPRAEGCP